MVAVLPFFILDKVEGLMSLTTVFRYIVLGVSVAAMIVGILVMAGFLVPKNLPNQFEFVIGAVVFLYGAYRFVVTFFPQRWSRDGSEE